MIKVPERGKRDKIIEELPNCPHLVLTVRPGPRLEAHCGIGLICNGDPKQCQSRLSAYSEDE